MGGLKRNRQPNQEVKIINTETNVVNSEDKKSINVYLPISLHKQLKQLALDTDTNVSVLIEKAIRKEYTL